MIPLPPELDGGGGREEIVATGAACGLSSTPIWKDCAESIDWISRITLSYGSRATSKGLW